ncbi:hypothetical protein [Kitasatospora sp. DSM 101779]|uniref:hypothetical protein n=1 Tax=Kitasatospora sp. DSM 101779 TaxID=2853165 RepID=UPI0021DAAD33|nr:hypothetical protein [Kitasatospora sp. DSM 101779]MCU7827200.1 hypothetical protein [Kitasatospora sp. DSM 101779]
MCRVLSRSVLAALALLLTAACGSAAPAKESAHEYTARQSICAALPLDVLTDPLGDPDEKPVPTSGEVENAPQGRCRASYWGKDTSPYAKSRVFVYVTYLPGPADARSRYASQLGNDPTFAVGGKVSEVKGVGQAAYRYRNTVGSGTPRPQLELIAQDGNALIEVIVHAGLQQTPDEKTLTALEDRTAVFADGALKALRA